MTTSQIARARLAALAPVRHEPPREPRWRRLVRRALTALGRAARQPINFFSHGPYDGPGV